VHPARHHRVRQPVRVAGSNRANAACSPLA
jgi:hypothetical protein